MSTKAAKDRARTNLLKRRYDQGLRQLGGLWVREEQRSKMLEIIKTETSSGTPVEFADIVTTLIENPKLSWEQARKKVSPKYNAWSPSRGLVTEAG